MYTNALTFPVAVAAVLISIAILPGMLADDVQDEQPVEMMDARSPTDDQIDLRYLLQNFLQNREARAWNPTSHLRQQSKCSGDRCSYAWKRGFNAPVARIDARGAPDWSTSKFSSAGCSGNSCLAGWKRGFKLSPQFVDEDN